MNPTLAIPVLATSKPTPALPPPVVGVNNSRLSLASFALSCPRWNLSRLVSYVQAERRRGLTRCSCSTESWTVEDTSKLRPSSSRRDLAALPPSRLSLPARSTHLKLPFYASPIPPQQVPPSRNPRMTPLRRPRREWKPYHLLLDTLDSIRDGSRHDGRGGLVLEAVKEGRTAGRVGWWKGGRGGFFRSRRQEMGSSIDVVGRGLDTVDQYELALHGWGASLAL
jgi:hypothetical protein